MFLPSGSGQSEYGLILRLFLFHPAFVLGAAHGTEDIDFLFITDELFPEFFGPEKGDIPTGAGWTFRSHPILALGHLATLLTGVG